MPLWLTATNITLVAFAISILWFCFYLMTEPHNDEKGAMYVFIVGSIFGIAFTKLLS